MKHFTEHIDNIFYGMISSNTVLDLMDVDLSMTSGMIDSNGKKWYPVLSRQYEQNRGDDLPEEIVQVYEVLETIWQNYACEEVFQPLFRALETTPEEVVQEIKNSSLSLPMWVYTTIELNCLGIDNRSTPIEYLLSVVSAKIDETECLDSPSEDSPAETTDDAQATAHLHQLEQEVDSLRTTVAELTERVNRLEKAATPTPQVHEVPVEAEETEDAQVDSEQSIESYQKKIASLEEQGAFDTPAEQMQLITALGELADMHFGLEEWEQAEPYYVRASDLIEEWNLFENYSGTSDTLIKNLVHIYKETKRHYDASRLEIRFK